MPFPGSILYYSYEADDQGKYLVGQLSNFNETYDASKFSLTNYLSQNQGSHPTKPRNKRSGSAILDQRHPRKKSQRSFRVCNLY
jgi:hypothetical protein